MIRFFVLLALLALAASGCAPNPGVITITNFSFASTPCAVQAAPMTYAVGGTLDLAGGVAPQVPRYYTQIEFNTAMTTQGVQLSNGNPNLENPNRERIVLDNLHVTYTIKKGGAAAKTLTATDDLPVSGSYEGTSLKNQMLTNVIGPKGGAALMNEVPAATTSPVKAEDIVELRLSVSIEGHLSGSGTHVSSGPAVYPIQAFRSATTCGANGFASVIDQCPFGGQDGSAPRCAP